MKRNGPLGHKQSDNTGVSKNETNMKLEIAIVLKKYSEERGIHENITKSEMHIMCAHALCDL